ncbi:MAG: tRNA-intron lyase [Candidatus Marsarchaeota archaeon]|nr:tRNA-intron lyase [Candidatus Marsarchaeota archaeon]
MVDRLGLLINIEEKTRSIYVIDQSSQDNLRNGHIGIKIMNKYTLRPEEALYVMDVRKAECISDSGGKLTFNDVAMLFNKNNKFMARYFTYKDWRDRGLVIEYPQEHGNDGNIKKDKQINVKAYPSIKLKISTKSVNGVFFEDDLVSIIDKSDVGREIYNNYWFGQYGTYKASDHGSLNKLDIYETLFLMERGVLNIEGYTKNEIISIATSRRSDFQKLYSIYVDWRDNGYVLKTGFKFGTHFRIYFPGAQPIKNDEWIHSKHVIHVFPRDLKLLISEWARVIRVAHSVRKTFILAIPGRSRKKKLSIDFVLYYRKNGVTETPGKDIPKYSMLSLSEDEYIGGSELSAIINEARARNSELIIAIADRETSVTYYKIKQIKLPSSEFEYYEIDWMQP